MVKGHGQENSESEGGAVVLRVMGGSWQIFRTGNKGA